MGSPLYRAGLTAGDTIVSLDGRPVATQEAMAAVLAARKPGDAVPIVFAGVAGRRTATLQVAENPVLQVVTYEAAGRPVNRAIRAFRESWLGPKAGGR
jgi:S1-C subfamily serine protease